MDFIEIIKAIILGIVEGITEWLPISSTGHMILVDEFIKMDVSAAFMEMFLVVIQLGAILAVVVIYWKTLIPTDKKTWIMWAKIIVSCLPAAVIGLLFDDLFTALFFNWYTVAIALIVFGIAFIIIENKNKTLQPKVETLDDLSFGQAFIIGLFQVIAAVFPGTSRSGATIVGAMLIGTNRTVAAEFTFYLAIPVMLGASLLKVVKFLFDGGVMGGTEIVYLLVGMIVAFVVSIVVIKFLMSFIKKHDFKVFGIYRIILGIAVLVYFAIN